MTLVKTNIEPSWCKDANEIFTPDSKVIIPKAI
jgi:hypothetical protein